MKLGGLRVVVLLSLAACGGDPSPVALDAAAPDAAIAPDAAPCNAISNVGADVSEVGVAEVAPTPQGGTIVDGTYAITAAVIYTGVGGQTGPDSIVYHATSVNTAGEYQYVDTGTGAAVTAGTYETSGTDDILIVQNCPSTGVVGYQKYTATPTEFTIYDVSNPAAVGAITFTLQP